MVDPSDVAAPGEAAAPDTVELSTVSAADRRAKIRAAIFDGRPLKQPRVGRFVLLETLGRGGMGTVLKAYDESLDRAVAVKLLHEGTGERHTQRLLREAQALAKLSHPNVIHVYEVGQTDGQGFIAMELVRGTTLRKWQHSAREWRECLEVYKQAGAGLVAAHAQGLVHRDFKPDNCILDDEGRVRVLDFGLVYESGVGSHSDRVDRTIEPDSSERRLTRTGTVLGTLAYMPLEQHEGRRADARSDQFSFCVSLYQALYGERPFAGESVAQLRAAVMNEEVRPPPKGSRVPTRLRRALLRGLSADPSERWPTMTALLTELERLEDPGRSLRLLTAGALVATLVGLGAWRYAVHVEGLCQGGHSALAGVWDDARRDEIRDRMHASGAAYASTTAHRVVEALDHYADAWISSHVAACEANRRGEQSAELLDARMRCLDGRRRALQSLVDVLARASAGSPRRAVVAASELPRVQPCSDVDYVLSSVSPPDDPRLAARVEHERDRVARAHTLRRMGLYDEALHVSTQAVASAEGAAYSPLLAEASLALGLSRERVAEHDGARQALERALVLAEETRYDEVARQAATSLAYVVGVRLARFEAGARWGTLAAAKARASGDVIALAKSTSVIAEIDQRLGRHEDAHRGLLQALELVESSEPRNEMERARLLHLLGSLENARGDYGRAVDYHRRALDLTAKTLGTRHPRHGGSLMQVGVSIQKLGDSAEALRLLDEALAIQRRALGDTHPDTAATWTALANLHLAEGRYEPALELLDQVVAVDLAKLGPDHPTLATQLVNIGNAYFLQRRLDPALAAYQRALAIDERLFGRDHVETATALASVGNTYRLRGDFAPAREHLERALEVFADVLGEAHPDYANTLSNLGELHHVEGDHTHALRRYRRAAEIFEVALGPDHPASFSPLAGVARSLLALERPSEAKEPAERALAILEARPSDPGRLADARYLVARSLWDGGVDRERGRALAQQALEGFEEAGWRDAIDEVERWLQQAG